MIPPITGKDLKVFRILKGFKTRDEFADWSGKSLSTIHRYESLDELTDSAQFFYETKLRWNIRGMKRSLDNFLNSNKLDTDDIEEILEVLKAILNLKRFWNLKGY